MLRASILFWTFFKPEAFFQLIYFLRPRGPWGRVEEMLRRFFDFVQNFREIS